MKNKEIEELLEDVKRHLDHVNDSGLKSVRDIEMEKMYYYILDLKNNRDKAIEEIDYLINNYDISDYQGEKLKNILKGDIE